MSATVLGLLAPLFVSLAPSAPASGDDQVVYLGRKKHPVAELPDDLPQSARDAVELWAPWAKDNEYRLDLSENGLTLLVSIDGNKAKRNAAKNMKLIEEILEYSEEIMPLPPTRAAQTQEADQDDEDDDSYEWGHIERETQTAVLLELDDLIHYSAAINHMVKANKYLGRWASNVGNDTGFVAEDPLTGAWLPSTGVTEDYEGEAVNEMVNRLGQMLMLRRFGQQPYWIRMGIAWHIEMKVTGGVYCFPYRSGFVSASSHSSWDKLLENRVDKRDTPLTMDEVAGLERGRWDSAAAEMAWGTVTFLVRFHPEALPKILDEFYTAWDEGGRDEQDDGTWERIAGYEPPKELQLEIIEKHVPNFLPELLEFFAKGKRYKP